MASSWRDNREKFGAGGYYAGLLEGDRALRFLAVLNPPVVVPFLGTMTHIGVGRRTIAQQRYYLGILTTVGVGGTFIWQASNVKAPGLTFPFADFPVLPD